MRRVLTLSLVMLLLVAACGGGSGDEGTDEPATEGNGGQTAATDADTDDSGETPTTATSSAADSDDQGSGADVSVGTVTVAGETYHFADTGFPGLQCMPSSFNVAFLAALRQVDENGGELDGSLSVGIPFKGKEETAGIMPELDASVGDLEWIANPEHADLNGIPVGSSQVDSYEIDGDTITGTATFYEENSSYGDGDLVVEQGTFEVTCAES
ncbi:MAG: hypothetical protein WCE80_14490 [Acidimicrobiia bacterium]